MSKKVLILSKADYFSSGINRECYIHPLNKDLCIKIPKSKSKIKKTLFEVWYLKSIKWRLRSKRSYFSDYLYTVNTNKGKGYVYDLITNQVSGNISNTLEHEYLDALYKDQFLRLKKLNKKIEQLQQNLLMDKVIVTDLNAKNIVLRRSDGDFELVIIDGIGRNSYSPIILDFFGLVRKRDIQNSYNKELRLIINSFILARNVFKKKQQKNSLSPRHDFLTKA